LINPHLQPLVQVKIRTCFGLHTPSDREQFEVVAPLISMRLDHMDVVLLLTMVPTMVMHYLHLMVNIVNMGGHIQALMLRRVRLIIKMQDQRIQDLQLLHTTALMCNTLHQRQDVQRMLM
jgi:hypothetical protein